jgi:glutathione S-transferase
MVAIPRILPAHLGQRRASTPYVLRSSTAHSTREDAVDGTPIFESLAILLYLGERYGVEKDLFPPLGLARAEAFKWMAWSGVTLLDAGGRMLRNSSDRFPADQRNEKAAEAAKKELAELLGILDRQLEGKEYLVDGKFSLADLAVAAYMPFLSRIGGDLNPHKNIQAWVARCTTRPAMGRAMMG